MIVARRHITRRWPHFIAIALSFFLDCGLPKLAVADPVTDDGRALMAAIGKNDYLVARTILRRGNVDGNGYADGRFKRSFLKEALLTQADDRLIDLLMENGANQEGWDYFAGRSSGAYAVAVGGVKRRGAESTLRIIRALRSKKFEHIRGVKENVSLLSVNGLPRPDFLSIVDELAADGVDLKGEFRNGTLKMVRVFDTGLEATWPDLLKIIDVNEADASGNTIASVYAGANCTVESWQEDNPNWFCNEDPARLRKIETAVLSPAFKGDTLLQKAGGWTTFDHLGFTSGQIGRNCFSIPRDVSPVQDDIRDFLNATFSTELSQWTPVKDPSCSVRVSTLICKCPRP
ncbi:MULTISPECIES: hypothetical protein [unclassified Rhizobium]|uniref:hypothetical protein n=1 Tax=unclassified Rhizobium TaxID=2613769 RepID=UPI001469E685|nr:MULTISPECIES: hypothetical protein [unclassified Rhizobium]MBD9450360.1 hypothetical protein [Rhizobium sp. RHZ02]NMN71847.1 hypothetical protein [Rhizobium sp. 57MFTsu3.2]